MTLADLIAEGLALARPCFLLSEAHGERLAGYWGGERSDLPNAVPPESTRLAARSHITTLDGSLFADLGLSCPTDPLSLFTTRRTSGGDFLSVERPRFPAFSDICCTGRRLGAVPGSSFPPFEAVCLYGSDSVRQWLSSLGLQRHEYDRASSQTISREYQTEFQRRAPFYGGAADVVVGGWHMTWPDDDFFMPLEMRLLATTIRDAEPFYEIWLSEAGNISVETRIT